eukprot:scaffold2585_cov135-Cylindrotheca_fusiformis.AAC.2
MEINTKNDVEYALHESENSKRATSTTTTTSLNDKFDTQHVRQSSDGSIVGQAEQRIIDFVGSKVTPRQLLCVLQVLKGITTCFLLMTMAANIMYIVFVEVVASQEVKELAGGHRDLLIRIFGIALNTVAILIELDYSQYIKEFCGLKGFICRGFMISFIAIVTSPDPTHYALVQAHGDDDVYMSNASNEIPGSAVAFQMTASFVLGCCGFVYLVFGLLLIDRFTSETFLSTENPLVTTAIPSPDAIQATDVPSSKPAAFHTP